MGKSISKSHEEYKRDQIKCRGMVEKYSFKQGVGKKRYFILKESSLGYSKSKDMPLSHVIQIDQTFKILYEDLEKREISIECTNKRGENALWKLIFPSQKSTEKWSEKLKKAVRPVWQDPNSERCTVCDKNFQVFRRQHHCRKCGKVICSAHCRVIEGLPELGYNERVKICSNCVNRIGNINGVERAKSLSEKESLKASAFKHKSVFMSPQSMLE
ncbi:hypothetical protein SteCoe_31964 [Stentor coeruleus]|uniref:FYVE-type domain-containing protein n=1 Tax=Stentor coeruleus TaxID=5963 RepID=A0A1R2B042_9CILI|nr:hypothetical protein SteCoe_31964 [Stentor coeruleus]